MLLLKTTTTTTTVSLPLLTISSALSLSKPTAFPFPPTTTRPLTLRHNTPKIMSWLGKLGFGTRTPAASSIEANNISSVAQGPDDDLPAPGQQFAQFGAGCFWGVELAFQRVPGVSKTEVGYTQGFTDNPSYNDICSGTTNHSEVVRVQYDPKACSFDSLLDCFWERHDPTTLNRQQDSPPSLIMVHGLLISVSYLPGKLLPDKSFGLSYAHLGNDVGTQYRSGIYFYTPEQEKAALESKERHQQKINRTIVTEILPAKKFYRAEEYHQQYLAKGGRFGFKQSTNKGCNDPIRCYG
ncbi:hypothetical protein OSB04_017447 [Centaurea solstitialis]|uniref:peptide-methionine (S)-S-oxide reductase n=1 Tax=Centaurea solstitialis TaxID=347529 RepID=A0AA38W9H1_9ASTR|nr:hypothetical protein OSB04_017447 [Centaurea solstitialis]